MRRHRENSRLWHYSDTLLGLDTGTRSRTHKSHTRGGRFFGAPRPSSLSPERGRVHARDETPNAVLPRSPRSLDRLRAKTTGLPRVVADLATALLKTNRFPSCRETPYRLCPLTDLRPVVGKLGNRRGGCRAVDPDTCADYS